MNYFQLINMPPIHPPPPSSLSPNKAGTELGSVQSQPVCIYCSMLAIGPKIICQGSRRDCNECKSLHNDIIEGEQWPTGVYFDGETSVIIAGADLKATVVADGTDAKVLIADHK